MVIKQYITPAGEVIKYEYLKKPKKTRKPRCPYCKESLRYLQIVRYRAYDKIGFFCDFCNIAFIDIKYNALRVRWEKE